jgi:hypothetical protein
MSDWTCLLKERAYAFSTIEHWMRLAPVLDLEALVAPGDGIANREVPQGGAAGDAGE